MKTCGGQKYRNLTVIQGGRSPIRGRRRGRRVRTAAELVLDQWMRDEFVRWHSSTGVVPSEGVQKIREGEQHPWRFLARRAVEGHDGGVPHATVRGTLMRLVVWVDRLYGASAETREVVLYQAPRLVA